MATRRRGRRGGLEDFATGFANTYGAFDKVAKSIDDTNMRDELKVAQEKGAITDTPTASGEETLAAVQQSLQDRLAAATTPEEQQKIQDDYAPVIQGAESQRDTKAGVVKSMGTGEGFKQSATSFTPEEVNQNTLNTMAAREGIYRKYGKDDEADRLQDRSLNRQAAVLAIEQAKRKAQDEKDEATINDKYRKLFADPVGAAMNAYNNDHGLLGLGNHAGATIDVVDMANGMKRVTQYDKDNNPMGFKDLSPEDLTNAGMLALQKNHALELAAANPGKFMGMAMKMAQGDRDFQLKLNEIARQSEQFNRTQTESERHNATAEGTARISAEAAASNTASTVALHGVQMKKIDDDSAEKAALDGLRAERSAAIDSGDKDAEAKADKKMVGYLRGGKGAQHANALELKAMLYLQSGDAKTLSEALKMANQKVQASAQDNYLKLTTSAMPLQGENLNEAMTTLHGKNWRSAVNPAGGVGASGAPAATPKTKADFDNLPSGTIYTNPDDGKKYRKP